MAAAAAAAAGASLTYRSGLIRKNYICDLDKSIGGGIYCFENWEEADSWFDEEGIRWLTDCYSKPNIEYFNNAVIVDSVSGRLATLVIDVESVQ